MEATSKNNLSDTYKLNREQWNMISIGATGWNFSTRFKEHKTAQTLKGDKSLFGKHTNDEEHTNNYTILKVKHNTQKRKLFEELEINKQKNPPHQPHEQHYKL